MAEKKKDTRARTWTLIIYPDSAPENWREIIDAEHIPWIESPKHDKDTNPDGTVKKAHWHIMLMFEGKKSFEQVKEIADKLNAPIPQRCASPKGMVRYFIHLDNPEKFQYNKADIIAHGGADVDFYFKMSMSNQLDILKDIVSFIHENHVTSLMELSQYCITHGNDEWFEVISMKSTLYLNAVLKSEYQQLERDRVEQYKQSLTEDNSDSSLDPECVNRIYKMGDKGISATKIASTLGISRMTVYRYLRKRK